jgi:hypothetical protein
MSRLLVVLLVLVLATPVMAREIDGATVTLVSPTSVTPGVTQTMLFTVQNASSDAEWIAQVEIHFPGGVLHQETMGYQVLVASPLRPNFTMTVYPTVPTAVWADGNGGYGEIYSTESCDVWVDWTAPTPIEPPVITWELWGDVWGAEPHYVTGTIDLVVTPVEMSTWSAIKALYR